MPKVQAEKLATVRRSQGQHESCAPQARGEMKGKKVVTSETDVVKSLISQNRRALFLKAGVCVLVTAAAVALFASGVAALTAPMILIYPAPSMASAYVSIIVGGVVAPVSTYKAVQFIKAFLKARAWTPEGIIFAGRSAHLTPVTAQNFHEVVRLHDAHNRRVRQDNDENDARVDTASQA